MAFYMATTGISPDKTAMEISVLLSKCGAKQILTTYDDGEVVGLSFMIQKSGSNIPFKLPIKWEPVLKAMEQDRSTPRRLCHKDQAIKVAWRIVLRWVQAQLALVETGSAEVEEIFLPYATTKTGESVYEIYCGSKFKQLAAPGGQQ